LDFPIFWKPPATPPRRRKAAACLAENGLFLKEKIGARKIKKCKGNFSARFRAQRAEPRDSDGSPRNPC
jgi:hypothetical protein